VKISRYHEIESVQEMPGVMKKIAVGEDEGAPNFIMRVFEVHPGSSTPLHTHAWEHEIYVLSGKGIAVSESGETPISQDSVVYVAPEDKHCFTNNGNEILRFICVIPKV